MNPPAQRLNEAWATQLALVMDKGETVSPRGQVTLEIPQRTLIFDMNYPVITVPERKMGYRFMAAEAWWILSGRSDLESIEPYSKEIGRFSDDGEHFFGAYGPPIVSQLDYVVDALSRDVHTRQAVLTIWRQNPPETKDVPCTVAMSFMIRGGKLNTHVFMRSSDNWLGIPYDTFNFTMVTCEILRRVNNERVTKLGLGTMFLTAASSHIYERNFEAVEAVLNAETAPPAYMPVPPFLYGVYELARNTYMDTVTFLRYLKDIRDKEEKRYRWWNRPA